MSLLDTRTIVLSFVIKVTISIVVLIRPSTITSSTPVTVTGTGVFQFWRSNRISDVSTVASEISLLDIRIFVWLFGGLFNVTISILCVANSLTTILSISPFLSPESKSVRRSVSPSSGFTTALAPTVAEPEVKFVPRATVNTSRLTRLLILALCAPTPKEVKFTGMSLERLPWLAFPHMLGIII